MVISSNKSSYGEICFAFKSAKIWGGGQLPHPPAPLVPPGLPMKERIKSRDLILLEDEDDTAPFITGQCGCFELLLAPIHSIASCTYYYFLEISRGKTNEFDICSYCIYTRGYKS